MSEKSTISRRTVVGSAGIGLAAAAAPSLAKGNSEIAAHELQNPADKYPKPPYKQQSQPWPRLASRMDPRPDHGEESYRGSGRLAGRKALITGGDSGMGRAAAIAYAARVLTSPSTIFRPRSRMGPARGTAGWMVPWRNDLFQLAFLDSEKYRVPSYVCLAHS
jgi:hypothetical protein